MGHHEPFGGLVALIETAHVHKQFTGHMIGFSWVVWETVDVLGAVVCCTLVFGGQIGPRHAGLVVNGTVVFSRVVAPSKFSGQELTSGEKIFEINNEAHPIERVGCRGLCIRRGVSRACFVLNSSWCLGICWDRPPTQRGSATYYSFCPVPTFPRLPEVVRFYGNGSTHTRIGPIQCPGVDRTFVYASGHLSLCRCGTSRSSAFWSREGTNQH